MTGSPTPRSERRLAASWLESGRCCRRPGATAVLLRFIQQLDLPFEQFVLEFLPRKVEFDGFLEFWLAYVTLVQTTAHEDAGSRQRDLPFPTEPLASFRGTYNVTSPAP